MDSLLHWCLIFILSLFLLIEVVKKIINKNKRLEQLKQKSKDDLTLQECYELLNKTFSKYNEGILYGVREKVQRELLGNEKFYANYWYKMRIFSEELQYHGYIMSLSNEARHIDHLNKIQDTVKSLGVLKLLNLIKCELPHIFHAVKKVLQDDLSIIIDGNPVEVLDDDKKIEFLAEAKYKKILEGSRNYSIYWGKHNINQFLGEVVMMEKLYWNSTLYFFQRNYSFGHVSSMLGILQVLAPTMHRRLLPLQDNYFTGEVKESPTLEGLQEAADTRLDPLQDNFFIRPADICSKPSTGLAESSDTFGGNQ